MKIMDRQAGERCGIMSVSEKNGLAIITEKEK